VPLNPAYPGAAGRDTFRPKFARSDEPKVNKLQMKFKDRMTKFIKEKILAMESFGIHWIPLYRETLKFGFD
jgi:hypothetical protein